MVLQAKHAYIVAVTSAASTQHAHCFSTTALQGDALDAVTLARVARPLRGGFGHIAFAPEPDADLLNEQLYNDTTGHKKTQQWSERLWT